MHHAETKKLSIRSFPAASIARRKTKCSSRNHLSFFEFCKNSYAPALQENRAVTGVEVCHNTVNILTDKLTHPGSAKALHLASSPTVGFACKLLAANTYWYREFAFTKGLSQNWDSKDVKPSSYAVLIARLLAGRSSPEGKVKLDSLQNAPLSPVGYRNFKSVIVSVDTLLASFAIAFPDMEIHQQWDYWDKLTRKLIGLLIRSYFPNGETRSYNKIKTVRGQIKELGFRQDSKMSNLELEGLWFYKPYLSFLDETRGDSEKLFLWRVSLISQNRMFGHPPHSVMREALSKWKDTVMGPKEVAPAAVRAISAAAKVVLAKTLSADSGSDFHRLKYLTKVSLQSSAEIDVGVKYGGKFEAARQCFQHIKQHPVKRINLETGMIEEILDEKNSSPGERLFFYALGVARSKDRSTLMNMRVFAVTENGKSRVITISEFLHGVILHPISHILLEILKKIPSSRSGVSAADHGWNLFVDIRLDNSEVFWLNQSMPWLAYLSSDLENATDAIQFQITRAILDATRHFVRVGTFYWKVIMWLLTTPRRVIGFKVFDEEDHLSTEIEEDFCTQAGALMGDPVTKFVLHMVHLVSREISRNFINKIEPPMSIVEFPSYDAQPIVDEIDKLLDELILHGV